jgi:bacterioferritin-associated ferredoxin
VVLNGGVGERDIYDTAASTNAKDDQELNKREGVIFCCPEQLKKRTKF